MTEFTASALMEKVMEMSKELVHQAIEDYLGNLTVALESYDLGVMRHREAEQIDGDLPPTNELMAVDNLSVLISFPMFIMHNEQPDSEWATVVGTLLRVSYYLGKGWLNPEETLTEESLNRIREQIRGIHESRRTREEDPIGGDGQSARSEPSPLDDDQTAN